MADEKLAYRISEFADAIGCSRAKAYELVASGQVPSVKIGSLRRVPVSVAKKIIEQQLVEQERAASEQKR